MAYTLPDGSKLFLGTTFAAPIAITELSNANPAVATATAHGLQAGAVFILKSGWEDANDRIFRVGAAPAANTFVIEGLNSTDTNMFTPGGGLGSVTPITGWQEIQQVLNQIGRAHV